MSLFGNLFGDDPNAAAELALAAGLLGGRGSFGAVLGNALMGGQSAYQGALAAQQQRELHGTQLARAKREEQQMREAMERQRRIEAAAQAAYRSPAQQALGAGGGPTPAAAQAMQGMRPQFDQEAFLAQLAGIDPLKAFELQGKGQREGFTLSPGAVRYDASGRQVAAAPSAEAKMPETLRALALVYGEGTPAYQKAAREYAQKLTTHQPAVSVSYGSPVAGVDEHGRPVFFQPDKGGGKPAIVPGVQPAPRTPDKLTEAEGKATAYASQMAAARKELSEIGYEPNTVIRQAQVGVAGTPARIVAPEQAQRVRQAQEQWSEAYLRFKTGAAATEAEVARNVKTYFPQIGDAPAVIEQKERMRQQAENDVLYSAGRGAEHVRATGDKPGGAVKSGTDLGGGFRVK